MLALRAQQLCLDVLPAAIIVVTSSECEDPRILSGLTIHRILDHVDTANNQRHHGYEIRTSGDVRDVLMGLLKAELLDGTDIKVTLPAGEAHAFVYSYAKLRTEMAQQGTSNEACARAHITDGATLRSEEYKTQEVIIRIETGEELTNAIFTPSRSPYGEIEPALTTLVEDYEIRLDHTEQMRNTTAHISWKVTRVENFFRSAGANKDAGDTNILAAMLRTRASIGGNETNM